MLAAYLVPDFKSTPVTALARRQRLNPQIVHEIWNEIDESARYGSIFRESVERATFGPDAPKTDVWYASPLSYLYFRI